jgi:hypothetical protein
VGPSLARLPEFTFLTDAATAGIEQASKKIG